MKNPKIKDGGVCRSAKKPAYWLLPFEILVVIVRRFELGARHYEINNWQNGRNRVSDVREFYSHLFEHLLKFAAGTEDEDTRLDNIAAVVVNGMFLIWYVLKDPKTVEQAFYGDWRGEKLDAPVKRRRVNVPSRAPKAA